MSSLKCCLNKLLRIKNIRLDIDAKGEMSEVFLLRLQPEAIWVYNNVTCMSAGQA